MGKLQGKTCQQGWTFAYQLSCDLRKGWEFQGTQGGAVWVEVRSEGRPVCEEERAGLWGVVGRGREPGTGQEWGMVCGLLSGSFKLGPCGNVELWVKGSWVQIIIVLLMRMVCLGKYFPERQCPYL